jgi:AraC-like DNA-binding protein
MEKRLKLLWVNMQISDSENAHLAALGNYFEIVRCGRDSRLAQFLIEPAYDAICFDFDYPDRASLRLVEETKQLHPSIPMFVITLQHSEELAVWAFRSSMVDFIVKPLADDELLRCYKVLRDICKAKADKDDRVIRRQADTLPKTVFHSAADPEQILQPALYYIEKNFDKKIRADRVAKLCGVSSFRFSKLFKDVYGLTFREFLVRYRLREACRLLQTGRPTVTEVAFAVGFNDVSYFSRMFKRYFDVNPSDLLGSRSARDKYETMSMELRLPLH